MKHLIGAIILVSVLSGCCSSGGIQGAIDYQVNGCAGQGVIYAPAGYVHQPVVIEVEPSPEQKAHWLQIENAQKSTAEAIRAAQWRAENMPQ